MDVIFLTGVGAVISAVIVFVGSVWLLLTVILGARLAYFVTASITLAFVLIMALVWSVGTPLGPVGEFGKPVEESTPHWAGVAIGTDPDELDFEAAPDYPDDPWVAPDPDDPEQGARLAELENNAVDFLQAALDEGTIRNFGDAGDAAVVEDSGRLLETDDELYGAITFGLAENVAEEEVRADIAREAYEEEKVPIISEDEIEANTKAVVEQAGTVVAVMRFEPGNPLGKARTIAGGTLLLFVLHLFGLSRAERRTAAIRASTP